MRPRQQIERILENTADPEVAALARVALAVVGNYSCWLCGFDLKEHERSCDAHEAIEFFQGRIR